MMDLSIYLFEYRNCWHFYNKIGQT